MNRDHQYDDIEDIEDDIEDDQDDIVQDGSGIRVTPLMLDSMDEVQQSIAMSKPGWRVPDSVRDQDQVVADAHAEYCAWLTDAHRTPVADAKPERRPLTLDAARAAADAAYEERSQWLRDAHKERRP
jgi:hypothetical protein